MAETELHRRDILRAAITENPEGEWTSARAAQLYEATGWGPNRNTARQDLRALTRQGVLNRTVNGGRHVYTPTGAAA